MAETFKVGDIAIIQNASAHSQYNGVECEVIEPLQVRKGRISTGAIITFDGYRIRAADGKCFCAMPQNLRRKPPPRDELGRWDECPWRPSLTVDESR